MTLFPMKTIWFFDFFLLASPRAFETAAYFILEVSPETIWQHFKTQKLVIELIIVCLITIKIGVHNFEEAFFIHKFVALFKELHGQKVGKQWILFLRDLFTYLLGSEQSKMTLPAILRYKFISLITFQTRVRTIDSRINVVFFEFLLLFDDGNGRKSCEELKSRRWLLAWCCTTRRSKRKSSWNP